jgi:hypothetical protein
VVSVALLGFWAPPASAASAYQMEGGGQLNATSGPGLPACAGVAGNCTPTTSVFTFDTLPIVGTGVLADTPVAGQYNCPSSVTVTGTTAAFSINWSFSCSLEVGEGPDVITGSFGGAYPLFTGSFRIGTSGAPQSSRCTGGFAPTSFGQNAGGPTITGAQFVGECTAVTGVT